MIAELTVNRELADFAFQSMSDLEPGGYWLVFSQMLVPHRVRRSDNGAWIA